MSLTIDDWYNCEPPENWYNGNNTRGLDEEVHAERQGLLWRALRVIFGSFLGEMRNPVRPQEDHAINLVAQPAPATPLDPEGATPPASSSAAEGHLEISNASEVPEEACLPVSTCAVVLQDMHAGHSESESSSPSYLTDSESSHIEAGASALEANDDLILTKKKNKGHLHRQRSVPTPSSSSSETTHSSNEVDCDIISTPETFPNPQMYDDSSPQPLVAPYGHRYRKHKPTPRNSMTTSSSTNWQMQKEDYIREGNLSMHMLLHKERKKRMRLEEEVQELKCKLQLQGREIT